MIMNGFSDYQLAFDQSLDDAIEVGDEYLSRAEMIVVMEAKIEALRKERLDG
jgi:hypothetical protein